MNTQELLKVLRLYPTPSGFVFVPIHFSHDPDKGAEWEMRERAKYPTPEDFAREQGIDFGVHAGAPAYPRFVERKHLIRGLPYISTLPICLCVDFNVSPMVWEVAQIVQGWVHFIDEIKLDPATIDACVQIFRNKYAQHRAEVWVYGDATGSGRDVQTAKSNFDLMRLSFRGWQIEPSYRVPAANPFEADRLAAFNTKLGAPDGMPGIRIDPDRCPELVQDLREVILRDDGKKILKIYDPKNPYSKRTHASDAAGYLVFREWPVMTSGLVRTRREAEPLKPGRLMGSIDWGIHRRDKR